MTVRQQQIVSFALVVLCENWDELKPAWIYRDGGLPSPEEIAALLAELGPAHPANERLSGGSGPLVFLEGDLAAGFHAVGPLSLEESREWQEAECPTGTALPLLSREEMRRLREEARDG